MGRKKKHEEHVNHERWLVSFADMMTLLFALFVVLYALGQADLEKAKELKRSVQWAFHIAGEGKTKDSGLFEKQTHRTCVSAVKRHVARDTLVVRLYNVTTERVEEILRFDRDVSAAWHVNLLEERDSDAQVNGSDVVLVLRPHEIVTLEVELGKKVLDDCGSRPNIRV